MIDRESSTGWIAMAALLLLVGASAFRASGKASPSTPPAASQQARKPVLVELFTSEGCSSCPPADEVLALLERTQPVDGAEVIPLGEHVDYWNELGWADPFSSRIFSERQRLYAGSFGASRIYTPQMVVDGRAEFVGSDLARARKAISEAARREKADVRVSLSGEAGKTGDPTLSIQVMKVPVPAAKEKAEVLVAIVESGLRSDVNRGENAGRRLRHTAVVRSLASLGDLSDRGGNGFSAEMKLSLESPWRREALKAVVFVQECRSRRVVGVGSIALLPSGTSGSGGR